MAKKHKKKKGPPATCENYGGWTRTWKDLGEDRIKRWDDSEPSSRFGPRRVKADIISWDGFDPGAKHYRLSIYEEDNTYWCENDNAWVSIEGDHNKGREISGTFFSEREAMDMAKFYLKYFYAGYKEHYTFTGDSMIMKWFNEEVLS